MSIRPLLLSCLILISAFSSWAQRPVRGFNSITELAASDVSAPDPYVMVLTGSEISLWRWVAGDLSAADGSTIVRSTHRNAGLGNWLKYSSSSGTGGSDNLWTNDLGVLHPVDLTNNVTIGGKLEVKTNITFNGTTPVIIKGGSTYGNARGAGALDVQSGGGIATMVASGVNAVAVGTAATASGQNSIAVGNSASATAASAYVFGSGTSSGGFLYGSGTVSSSGLGYGSGVSAAANGAFAAGSGATANVAFTGNFAFPIMNWQSQTTKGGTNSIGDGTNTDARYYSGVEVVLMSQEVDLETTQDYTNSLPGNVHFYPDETGVIVTSANTVSGQPSFSFGISGNTTKLLGATAATGLTAAFKRQRFATLLTSEGETTLTGSVTTGATATTLLGRFYWKGLLVRDQ